MKKVTSILIGAGLRGGYVYSQYALDHSDEFQVVAVAEPDKERRELFAAKHHIPAEMCFESYEELLEKDKKITLNIVGEAQQEVALKNIYYFEAQRHGVLIYTTLGVKRCNDSMSEMEQKLDNKWFYRCHNSFIVNLDEIESLKGTVIYMKNGNDIDISRRKVSEFKKVFLKRQYECANG